MTMIASTEKAETTQERSPSQWKPLAMVAALLLISLCINLDFVLGSKRSDWPYYNVRLNHDNDERRRELVSISSLNSMTTAQPRLGGGADGDYACFQNGKELASAVDIYLKSKSSPLSFVALKYGHPIGTWCVGNVTNFDYIFDVTLSPWIPKFNEDLSGWDVSNAKSMIATFRGASSFNQDLTSWDVSKVENMADMFYMARSFNGSLSNWNVSSVKSMYRMFSDTEFFRRDLSSWDVSNVESMGGMFTRAIRFNSNLSTWIVSKVRDMSGMFFDTFLFNQDLSMWDVRSVEKFDDMFNAATAFNQNLCQWGNRLKLDATVTFMFSGTACDEQSDPVLTATPPGPFCAIC